ncbi:MAG: flagellar biosynthesis anti-sigma factor FlgM [Rubrivivax sp.]|nr:flagellar biosynthesis anti-sigma factor FlgM [Rubrivivax sp.]
MKIGPLESKPVATTPAERKAQPAQGPAQPQASTQVDLSPAATALTSTATDPAFDGAKVDRIAQAIRDGKFEVNPEAIADKLIANATELLARKPS